MPIPSPTEDPTPQSRCRFALGWRDITPPAGICHRMWGAARHDRATGVHRLLRAMVAVFAPIDGHERQILLALDHCVMGRTEHDVMVIASVASDWGASYLPPRDVYGTGIYQESIAVVAAGSLEQLIESIARRIAS